MKKLQWLFFRIQQVRLQLHVLFSSYCRITSYNVCYTKLLRSKSGSHRGLPVYRNGHAADCRCGATRDAPCRGYRARPVQGPVITSYSIHYTKLYDAPQPVGGAPGASGLLLGPAGLVGVTARAVIPSEARNPVALRGRGAAGSRAPNASGSYNFV